MNVKLTSSFSSKIVYTVRWRNNKEKMKSADFVHQRLAELFHKEKLEEGYKPTLWREETIIKTELLDTEAA